MLHNPHEIPIYTSFISKYAQIIDQICPILHCIDINMTDDEPCHLPIYFVNNPLYERGCFQSPFVCKPQFTCQGFTYNDIIMEVDSSFDFTEEELHALIAHEVGHFCLKYTNQILGHLPEEIEADRIACQIGFRQPLRIALQKMFGKSNSVLAPILQQRLIQL